MIASADDETTVTRVAGAARGTAPADAPLRIATRPSELALRQARQVQRALAVRGVPAELVPVRTTGDRRLGEPLHEIGGTGLFTHELERALASGRVDCCVHSLKDLPTESPPGLAVVAHLEREDPRDVLVVHHAIAAASLEELPRGTRVGTSSLRRRAQLLARRPDLEVVELRGNVPTRLRKVEDGQVQAAILAGAGLKRLEVPQRIDAWLEPPGWLPAAGQGVIAVQARADDDHVVALLRALDHAPSARAAVAERTFLAALQGGCQVPIGALVMPDGEQLVLHGLIAGLRGEGLVRGAEPVCAHDPARAGTALAAALLARGGAELLAALRTVHDVPAPQPE